MSERVEGRNPPGAAPATQFPEPSVPPPSADRLLDAEELAERLHVPVSWIRESTRAGILPAIFLGRYRRFRWADIEVWLEGQATGGRQGQLRKFAPTIAAAAERRDERA